MIALRGDCRLSILSVYSPVFSHDMAEEDVYSSYSYLLLKYYLSEGMMCGHHLLLSSASYHPTDILAVS